MREEHVISYTSILKAFIVFVVGVSVLVAVQLFSEESEEDTGTGTQTQQEETVAKETGTQKTKTQGNVDWKTYVSDGKIFQIQYPGEYYYVREKTNGAEMVNIFEEDEYNRAYREAQQTCVERGESDCSVYYSRTSSMLIVIKDDGRTIKEYANIYGATNKTCTVGGKKGLCTVASGYTDPIPYFLYEENGKVVIFSNVGTAQKPSVPLPTVDPRSSLLKDEREQIVGTFRFLK